jgi:RING-box protein 1
MAESGEVAASSREAPVKFEVKKWNAVALWSWGKRCRRYCRLCRLISVCFSTDVVVDNCAICRNHIMDICRRELNAERSLSHLP